MTYCCRWIKKTITRFSKIASVYCQSKELWNDALTPITLFLALLFLAFLQRCLKEKSKFLFNNALCLRQLRLKSNHVRLETPACHAGETLDPDRDFSWALNEDLMKRSDYRINCLSSAVFLLLIKVMNSVCVPRSCLKGIRPAFPTWLRPWMRRAQPRGLMGDPQS